MKKLIEWLYSIKADKYLHVLFGLLIAQIVFVLLNIACAPWLALLCAFLLASIVAGVKELIDVKYGVPSWKDFLASEVGIAVGLLVIVFV